MNIVSPFDELWRKGKLDLYAQFSYLFKTKTGNIIPFPDTKKQLVRLYPDRKAAIETFLKENKIKFDADADRIKIIDFLAN